MHILFRAILILAHVFYGFILVTRVYWLSAKRRFKNFLQDKEVVNKNTHAIGNVHKLRKIPKHFALILGFEEPSTSDLVQILTWCLISGIPYVTFYDSNGHLKKQEHYIKKEFLKAKPEFEEHIKWNPEPAMKTMKNGTNGIMHRTRIQFISYEDGKGKIIALTQDLANAVKIGSIEVEDVTLDLLDSKLNPENVPDPDLAVICGNTPSTYGFLPWHTRVTEFHVIPTHHSICVTEFINVLTDYSICEQRYGK